MTDTQLQELKTFIRKEVRLKRSKDFRFWGGIVVFLCIVILWGSFIGLKQQEEKMEIQIDPKAYSWDHAYDLFVKKYNYEKGNFARISYENIILKDCIDRLYYIYHRDEMFLTYQQKTDIIYRHYQLREVDCK